METIPKFIFKEDDDMKIIITTEIEIDENGNVEVLNVQQKEAEEEKIIKEAEKPVSQYACYYNKCTPNWSDSLEYNVMFLKAQECFANERLKKQGYLFLNDVYEMLGLPRTKEGQVVGWVYSEKNPIGDNYVDFGIFDCNKEIRCNFVNGYEKSILLDFNVDGDIMDICF